MMTQISCEADSVLLCALFLMQPGADGDGTVGVDGTLVFDDMLNGPFLVDNEGGAIGELALLVQDPVILGDLAVHVAEQGEGDADLCREFTVGGGAVDADAENLRVIRIDLSGGDTILVRLELFRSTAGEGQNVKRQYDGFLSAIIAQLDGLPIRTEQGEFRGFVAHFEIGVLNLRLLRRNRHGHSKDECCGTKACHSLHSCPPRNSVLREKYTLLARTRIRHQTMHSPGAL